MPPALIVCPSCACHAKSSETRCPTCGGLLRREDGGVPRAAVALLLGLTAASGVAANACSSTATGVATGSGGSTSSSSSSSTSSSSSGPVAFYGPAMTSGSTGSSSAASSSGHSSSGDAGTDGSDGG